MSKKNEPTLLIIQHSQDKLDELDYFIEAAITTCTDFDIAAVIAAYYNLDIIDYKNKIIPDYHFTNSLIRYYNKTWYVFVQQHHRWITESIESTILNNNISTTIVELFKDKLKEYKNKLKTACESYKDRYERLIKQTETIIKSLKQVGKKKNFIQEIKHLLYHHEFPNVLDTVKHTIGFTNGVFDFEEQKLRDGRPDDFISMSVKYDYIEYDKDHNKQKQLDIYLKQVYPNENIRNYIIDILGVAICCGKIEQFNILWGDSGANGKSTLMQLLQNTFGDYAKTMPVSFFLQKRAASNAAQSELVRLKGARLSISSEPDKDEIFNLGVMKELTGHDMLMARGLYQDPVEFELYAQFFLSCNEFPKIPLSSSNDGGTWRRLKVIPHDAYFYIGEEPPSNIRGKVFVKKDQDIDTKLKTFPKYLMSKIIHNILGKYPALEINIPKEVEYATDEYQKSSDIFKEFLEERTQKTRDSNAKILITKLYVNFQNYMKMTRQSNLNVTRQDLLKKLLQNDFNVSKDNRYVNYIKFKDDFEESDDESDEEPNNNQEIQAEYEIVEDFKRWLKNKFLARVDITKVDDIINRIPTQYIYNEYKKHYNRDISKTESDMIYDIINDYFDTNYQLMKKKAKNKIYADSPIMCICGLKLKEIPS